MRPRSRYVPGEYNQTCDRCGKSVKSSETTVDWDGFVVCKEHADGRHPQDHRARLPIDRVHTPDAGIRPADAFYVNGTLWNTESDVWETITAKWEARADLEDLL